MVRVVASSTVGENGLFVGERAGGPSVVPSTPRSHPSPDEPLLRRNRPAGRSRPRGGGCGGPHAPTTDRHRAYPSFRLAPGTTPSGRASRIGPNPSTIRLVSTLDVTNQARSPGGDDHGVRAGGGRPAGEGCPPWSWVRPSVTHAPSCRPRAASRRRPVHHRGQPMFPPAR